MRRTILAAALAASALPAPAQTVIRSPSASAVYSMTADPNRAMLGISTSSSGRRDTLGLLVTAVTTDGPADKAGLEEGNRLLSINGVSLRLSREDADDDFMQGVNQNRLTREMHKVKVGDEVTLEVWGSGRSRSVKVKTVSAEDLTPARSALTRTRVDDNRAALGVYLTTTGNRRDTAGVFVQQVVEGGPAEKAGIVEGDRIASINGVDLRVPREDAGDWSVSSSRVERMDREVRKLTAGQNAELVVVSGGRSRPVRVTAAKASDLPGGFSYRFGPGADGAMRMIGPQGSTFFGPGGLQISPKVRIERRMNDHDIEHFKDYEDFDFNRGFDRGHLESMLQDLRMLGPQIRADVKGEIDREIPKALYELRDLGPRIRAEIDEAIRDGRVIKRPIVDKIVIPSKTESKKTIRINL